MKEKEKVTLTTATAAASPFRAHLPNEPIPAIYDPDYSIKRHCIRTEPLGRDGARMHRRQFLPGHKQRKGSGFVLKNHKS